jgi:hypothetical protein
MKHKTPEPFLWLPGKGASEDAMMRMRTQFHRPAVAMGEAWFMGDDRRMYTELLQGLDNLSCSDLQTPLREILSGTSSFGAMPEWVNWYHYLLAQLISRSHEHDLNETLLEYLIGAFFTQYPVAIEEPYRGFRNDVLATLGQSMMDANCWQDGKIIPGRLLHRLRYNSGQFGLWDQVSGDFSSAAFFCAKYLKPEQIQAWLESMLKINCAHWNAQVMLWLLGAHDMFTGKIKLAAELNFSDRPNISWAWSYSLKGNYTGDYSDNTSAAPDFISLENRNEILRVLEKTLSEELFFTWLDAIKPCDYLESELAELPSRFAQIYL